MAKLGPMRISLPALGIDMEFGSVGQNENGIVMAANRVRLLRSSPNFESSDRWYREQGMEVIAVDTVEELAGGQNGDHNDRAGSNDDPEVVE